MIDFQRLDLSQKAAYEQYLMNATERGCEYSFSNLYLWGKQHAAFIHGCVALFSHFNGRSVYPFPIGDGDKRQVIGEILEDAKERGIPCRIIGITNEEQAFLESEFPGVFHLRIDRNSFDYVYDINDLADLRGRKYQKKRNHFNRFQAMHPDYQVLPLNEETRPAAMELVKSWYAKRAETDPEGDYLLEQLALKRVFKHFDELDMEGCVLMEGGQALALAMGSRMSPTTFDIQFEKGREDVDGAYAAINCEFARYLRLKYPEAQFLNREEDMGLEGLRKAKLSYLPHHMVEKYWAYLVEDLNEN